MNLISEHSTIESIFAPWRFELGEAHAAYRGHVYRQFNFTVALLDPERTADYGSEESILQRVAIAAAFHDIGVFLSHTMDYLGPSELRMKMWLEAQGKSDWLPELSAMVMFHHKLTTYRGDHAALAEPFRLADLVDVSLGRVQFGLPKEFVREVRDYFPNAGFHRGLVRAFARYALTHPFKPLPMMRL